MAEFCNQCARELGFPEGDFANLIEGGVRPGWGVVVICEGCGNTLADNDGNCINSYCEKQHGLVQTGKCTQHERKTIYSACLSAAHSLGSNIKKLSWFGKNQKG
jgi:hypothetical protein